MKLSTLDNIIIIAISIIIIIADIFCVIFKNMDIKIFVLTFFFFGNGIAFCIMELIYKNQSSLSLSIFDRRNRSQNILYSINGILFGICILWAPHVFKVSSFFKTMLFTIVGILFIFVCIVNVYIAIKGLKFNKLPNDSVEVMKAKYLPHINTFMNRVNFIVSVTFIIAIVLILLRFLVFRKFGH